MKGELLIVRPQYGKPSIHHLDAHTADVRAAVLEHGWGNLDKLAATLKKKGYSVEIRDHAHGATGDV